MSNLSVAWSNKETKLFCSKNIFAGLSVLVTPFVCRPTMIFDDFLVYNPGCCRSKRPVFPTRDILKRIQILEFVSYLQDVSFFAYYFFNVHLNHSLQIKRHKEVTNQ